MAAQDAYQLRVCDLRSDDTLDVLPIEGVSFDDYIGKTGSLSGTIPIPNADLATRAKAAILPGRTMAYLERGGQIVWGGVVWTRTPTMAGRVHTLPIQGAGLESILRGHRMLTDTLTAAGVDQLDIARGMVDYAQDADGGNLGIEIDYAQTSGVLRDRTYLRYDLPWIGVLLDQLAATEQGFEWRIQCYADTAGVRHRALRLGYPRLTPGGTSTTGDTVLTSPGPIVAYQLPEDATGLATAWQSRGASINTNQASASVPLMSALLTRPDLIALGWPRLDGTSDYSSVEQQSTLDQHAAADLARAAAPVTIPAVTILTGEAGLPALGGYVRLRIVDLWFPLPGLQARYRVVGLKVSPAERGRPETCELYLEAA